MTQDELTKHRLKQLEELATGWREAERRVDTLGLSIAAVEKTVTETHSEMRKNDEHTRNSLSRLHERLDEITQSERFEQGREQGQRDASSKTGRVIAQTVMAVIAFGGVIVATLNLILN